MACQKRFNSIGNFSRNIWISEKNLYSSWYKTDILKLVSIRVLKHLEMNALCFERHLICFVISLKGIKLKSRNLDILSPIPE